MTAPQSGRATVDHPVLRYRGLRIPQDPAFVTRDTANGLRDRSWRAPLIATMVELARTTDRALVMGNDLGIVGAILAGKLGLVQVTIVEPAAPRRAFLGTLALQNGLPRLRIIDQVPQNDPPPTLVIAQAPVRLPDGLRLALLALPSPDAVQRQDEAAGNAGLFPVADHCSDVVRTYSPAP